MNDQTLLPGIEEPNDPEFVALVRKEIAFADAGVRELMPVPDRPFPRRSRKAGWGSCAGCRGAYDDRTPGCRVCWTRHYQRERFLP